MQGTHGNLRQKRGQGGGSDKLPELDQTGQRPQNWIKEQKKALPVVHGSVGYLTTQLINNRKTSHYTRQNAFLTKRFDNYVSAFVFSDEGKEMKTSKGFCVFNTLVPDL